MRRELGWALVGAIALATGTLGAEPYVRMLSPYYLSMGRSIATGHPSWTVSDVDIGADDRNGSGTVLRMTGSLRRNDTDTTGPVYRIVSRLQMAVVAECPIIFWTVLAVWPLGSTRRRLGALLLGIPVFLGLEAATTVCQLLNGWAYGAAVLAGNPNTPTSWEHWSRFLENGGRIAVALGAAILTVAITLSTVAEKGRRASRLSAFETAPREAPQ
jgi:hypothetical protein